MKTEKLILLCIALFFFQLVACERNKMDQVLPSSATDRTGADEDSTGVNPDSTGVKADSAMGKIIADKTFDIKQKEPINFTLINPESQFVKWRVRPAETVINEGVKSTIYFQKAGNYRVFAIDSLSLDTAYIDVQVGDEIYSPPSGEQVFKANETLLITPGFRSDTANVIIFNAITDGSYNCRNNLLVTYTERPDDNTFQINVRGIATSLICEKGENKPKSMSYFVNPVGQQFSGKIEILFNNKTYTGSIKKEGNKYQIDWPYDSGVVFTTKSL